MQGPIVFRELITGSEGGGRVRQTSYFILSNNFNAARDTPASKVESYSLQFVY